MREEAPAAHAQPQHGTAVPTVSTAVQSVGSAPEWKMCWSTWNFTSFLVWFGEYATLPEQYDTSALYMVVHREQPSPFLIASGIVPEEVETPLRRRDGTTAHLPRLVCMDVGCRRCDEGRGGYQWRWCDPRWTPSAALDMQLNPLELARECYKPWPRGMLPSKSSRGETSHQPASAPLGREPAGGPAGSVTGPQPQAGSHRRGAAQRRPVEAAARGRASILPKWAPSLGESPGASSSGAAAPRAYRLLAGPEPSTTPAALQLPPAEAPASGGASPRDGPAGP